MSPSLLIDVQLVLLAAGLTAPRAVVMLAIVPGFGANTFSPALRAAVAFALTLPAVVPTFHALREIHGGTVLMLMLGGKEALIGLVLGVLLAIPMWALQSVGSILDMQRSPIQIQSGNASIDRDASALGGMLVQAMMIVMIQAGLLAGLVRILLDSYVAWPVASLAPPFDPGHGALLLARFGELLWHIVVYGAPLILTLLLIDLGTAVVGAFAPNLQVSFVSSPIKSLTGLFVLLVYWPTLAHYVAGDFARTLDVVPALLQGAGL